MAGGFQASSRVVVVLEMSQFTEDPADIKQSPAPPLHGEQMRGRGGAQHRPGPGRRRHVDGEHGGGERGPLQQVSNHIHS